MTTSQVPPTQDTMLEAALGYLRRGWSVIPLHNAPGGVCTCGRHVWPQDTSAGKHPRIEWTEFQSRRPTEEEVRKWWTDWPTANIGGVLGPVSGHLCIESDSAEKTRWIQDTCDGEPQTETHQAARGPHYIFLYPEGNEIPSCKVGPGVEVKSHGTLIVLPESIHPSGHVYTSNSLSAAPIPPALLDAIRGRGHSAPGHRMTRDELRVSYSSVPRGDQHNSLVALVGHYIAIGLPRDDVEEMALMVGHQYNPAADPEHVLRLVDSLYETHKRNHPAGHEELQTVPVLVSLADVQPEKPDWLTSYLLRGELNLLAGPTSAGKSYLALDCAARLTSGRNLFGTGVPGWTGNLPGRAVVMSREDSAGIIRSRFTLLGGDPARVALFSSKVTKQGQEDVVNIYDDLPTIRRALKELEPELLVVDNLAAFLGGRVDTRRVNQVRPILDGLVEVAAETRTAVLMIAHLNKRDGVDALERVMDSVDFVYRPRSILFLARDRDDDAKQRRVLTHEKSSYGPVADSLVLKISADGLTWDGTTEITSEELLAPARERSTPSKLEEAVGWLGAFLSNGPRSLKDVAGEAFKVNIKPETLDRARQVLHVVSYAHPKPGPGSEYRLRLPDMPGEDF